MPRSSWDRVWSDVALAVARRSACSRAQVGAVLVKENRVVSTGYNGPASGHPAPTALGCQAYCLRAKSGAIASDEYGYSCPSIHAEANALLYASRADTVGATLYVTHAPCADCAKLISNSGIKAVVMLEQPPEHRPNPIPYLESCRIWVGVMQP